MKTLAERKYLILAALLILAVSMAAINYIVKERLEDLTATVNLQIADQRTVLNDIAQTTARNGADSVTESVIRDCNNDERTQFDDLLGRLNSGLTPAELTTLERLFGRCGSFYSERKSVMVARLTREIEVYENYVSQLASVTGDQSVFETHSVTAWKSLAEAERAQSDLFSTLVVKQDLIISTLLQGKSPNSEDIATILRDVKETQETLLVTNRQAADIRSGFIAL